ncbi:hypothetical protein AB6E06_22820 [Vibrio splendidus]
MKNLKTKALVAATGLASASSFAAVDPSVQAGLDTMTSTATELSGAGLSAIIALNVVMIGIAVVIGIFKWAKRTAVN